MSEVNYTKKGAYIVKADKKLVDELLAMNHNNRNIKRGHLAWIKAAIKSNQFILTGQGIGVSKDHVLVDGQHRLHAIKESGYPPVELLVVTGLDEKAKIYIDQQAKRTPADMLKMVLDRDVNKEITSTLILDMGIKETEDGFTWAKMKVNLETLVGKMDSNQDLLSEIFEALGKKARVGIRCALFHYAKKVGKGRAIDFAEKVRTGTNLGATSPAYKLREYTLHNKKGWNRADVITDYAYTVAACVADSKGSKMEKLYMAKNWEGVTKSKK